MILDKLAVPFYDLGNTELGRSMSRRSGGLNLPTNRTVAGANTPSQSVIKFLSHCIILIWDKNLICIIIQRVYYQLCSITFRSSIEKTELEGTLNLQSVNAYFPRALVAANIGISWQDGAEDSKRGCIS
jgi:hypothetical protein